MPRYEPTTDDMNSAHEQATRIAREMRDYVRDRFTPGTLRSLDELHEEISARVEAAILAAITLRGMTWRERIGG